LQLARTAQREMQMPVQKAEKGLKMMFP